MGEEKRFLKNFTKTKVIVTLGPSTRDYKILRKIVSLGVRIFRLNFSHGDHNYHKKNIELIRKVEKEIGIPLTIIQDLSGPKIRVSSRIEPVLLHQGDLIEIFFKPVEPRLVKEKGKSCLQINIDFPEILKKLKKRKPVSFADGTIKTRVVDVLEDRVRLKVLNGGVLSSKKGVNFPSLDIELPALTEKDKKDLEFGVKKGVDLVCLSFVKEAEDILKTKDLMRSFKKELPVIAKIETYKALKNLDFILEVSDGVMVARGDLGVEIPIEKVPLYQKKIILKAREKTKPVIIATQMLTSMINSPVPSRADISDIANAVFDQADALMLSDETTIGKYPLDAVEVMKKTIKEAERHPELALKPEIRPSSEESIAYSGTVLATSMRLKKIVVFTKTGKSVLRVSKFRPEALIIGCVHDIEVLKYLNLVWGVLPYLKVESTLSEKMLETFLKNAKNDGLVKPGEEFVITMGYPAGLPGTTNLIRLVKA